MKLKRRIFTAVGYVTACMKTRRTDEMGYVIALSVFPVAQQANKSRLQGHFSATD